VTNSRILFMHIGARAQLVDAQTVVFGQPAQHGIGGQVILFDVQFAAIAGREDRSLTAVGQSAKLLQGLYQLLRGKRHALAHVYRSSLVVDTEGEKGHSRSLMMSRSR